MTDDIEEYRTRAAQCADMAARARTPQLQALLLDLSNGWKKLARRLHGETSLRRNEIESPQ